MNSTWCTLYIQLWCISRQTSSGSIRRYFKLCFPGVPRVSKTFHGRIPVFLSRLDPHFQMLLHMIVSSIDAKILFGILSLKKMLCRRTKSSGDTQEMIYRLRWTPYNREKSSSTLLSIGKVGSLKRTINNVPQWFGLSFCPSRSSLRCKVGNDWVY